MRLPTASIRSTLIIATAMLSFVHSARGLTIDFEDTSTPTPYGGPGGGSYYNGSDLAGGFSSQGVTFNNQFTDFGGDCCWEGWSASNTVDGTTAGVGNQYSAVAGSGAGGSSNYGVGFTNTFVLPGARIALPDEPVSLQVTNTTYAFLAVRDGNDGGAGFAKPGGFVDGDFFTLTIRGFDQGGVAVGSFDFDLADFRSDASDPTPNDPLPGNYILDDWTRVDLSPLQNLGTRILEFSLSSSDNGLFGMNTPGFFAIDNIRVASPAPEPASGAGALLGFVALLFAHRARMLRRRRPRR